jgi:NAD(P) transhydrogenase subunit alpha
MVDGMRPGSVVIDLAAAEGGNCELTPSDGEVEHHGVRVIAAPDLPSQMPGEASALYARNLLAVARLLVNVESGELQVDREDEIVAATLLVADGEVVHESLRGRERPQDEGAES